MYNPTFQNHVNSERNALLNWIRTARTQFWEEFAFFIRTTDSDPQQKAKNK